MKINKRLLLASAAFLALVTALLLCSCKKTDAAEGDTPGSEVSSEAPESATLELVKDGKITVARIVRAEELSSSDASEIVVGKKLRDTVNNIVKERFGGNISFEDSLSVAEDIRMPGETYDPSAVEILIGNTSYSESRAAYEGLAYGDYAVTVVGNKIAIAAYTDAGYNAAAAKLVKLIEGCADAGTRSVVLNKADIAFSGTVNKKLSAVPVYDGGTFGSYYKAGNAVDEIIIRKTGAAEFNAYLDKLAAAGYTRYTENEIKSNRFATYTNDKYTLTAGYYDYETSARIIVEPLADPVPLEAEKYTPVTTSQITLLGIEFKKSDGSFDSGGLSCLVRLADGSFVVIDGGFNRAACASNLAKTIRGQAKEYAAKDKDIRIAAWIVTHSHGDHSGMISRYSEIFKSFTVENFIVNFMSDAEREKAIAAVPKNWASTAEGSEYGRVLAAATNLGAKTRIAHVGQNYFFADAKFEILYTLESYGPAVCNAFNTTSMVIKATIDGSVFMITGDATGAGMQITEKMFGDYLKSDIVQVSHHGYTTFGNEAGTIAAYRRMSPTTLLWPQGGHAYPNYVGKNYNKALTEKSSNPNYAETFVAGSEGDTVVLPLPYKAGSAIVNRTSGSYIDGACTVKK